MPAGDAGGGLAAPFSPAACGQAPKLAMPVSSVFILTANAAGGRAYACVQLTTIALTRTLPLTKLGGRLQRVWEAQGEDARHILGAQVVADEQVQVGPADEGHQRHWRAGELGGVARLHPWRAATGCGTADGVDGCCGGVAAGLGCLGAFSCPSWGPAR